VRASLKNNKSRKRSHTVALLCPLSKKFAQSHRNVSAFKLVKKNNSKKSVAFNAFERYLLNGQETYREVLIRVTRQKSKKYLLEYFGKDKDREYNSNERYTIKPID
jgi:hypothetical protein